MKIKNFITVIIPIFIFFNGFGFKIYQLQAADDEFKKHVVIGMKLGIGTGFFSGEEFDKKMQDESTLRDVAPCLSAGLFFDVEVYRKNFFTLSLQPEILYTYTGGGYADNFSKENSSGATMNNSRIQRFQGIEFPLYIKPKFKFEKGNFFLICGINGYWILKNQVTESTPFYYTSLQMFTFKLGVGGGLGYEAVIGPVCLHIGISYIYYFLDAFNKLGGNKQNDIRLELGLGFLI